MTSSLGATPSSQFTAPSAGSYTLTSTFTDPYFDPFDGTGGSDHYNEAWAWDTGQSQFLIYKISGGTPSLLASGFPEDIASVNQASVPSVGNTITSGSGLSINSGTVLGSTLNSETGYSETIPPLVLQTPACRWFRWVPAARWAIRTPPNRPIRTRTAAVVLGR